MLEEEIDEHIASVGLVAVNAAESEKWRTNFDLIAAAKLFNVNVLDHSNFGWELYSPNINKSVNFLISIKPSKIRKTTFK